MPADFSEKMTYGSYLARDQVLGAQHPLRGHVHHDEMLPRLGDLISVVETVRAAAAVFRSVDPLSFPSKTAAAAAI